MVESRWETVGLPPVNAVEISISSESDAEIVSVSSVQRHRELEVKGGPLEMGLGQEMTM